MHPVQALKHRLQTLSGLSRFRQRLLFLDGDVVLDDEHTMRPGEVQVVRLNFCPSSQEQMNALRDAARSGRAAEVQTFLQRPQDPDSGHPTPLFVASQHGHLEVTRLLLEANADKDKAMNDGATPLFIASQEGQLEVAQLLLEANADKEKAMNDGATPLFIASQEGHMEVARLLLEANADKDKVQQTGVTPLLVAACHGQLAVVRLLLQAKADKDKAADNGHTPLSIAVQKGHLEVACLLRVLSPA